MLCSMSNTFCSMSTMFLCIWQTLTVTNLTDCLASITPCCLVTTPMETKVFMWRFSDVCPGIVWRACTACTHPHDDCTAHIMFCAAKPIHVCCKPPSVLQSTLCAAKHQVLQSNLCAAKHHILCAAKVLSVLQSNRLWHFCCSYWCCMVCSMPQRLWFTAVICQAMLDVSMMMTMGRWAEPWIVMFGNCLLLGNDCLDVLDASMIMIWTIWACIKHSDIVHVPAAIKFWLSPVTCFSLSQNHNSQCWTGDNLR